MTDFRDWMRTLEAEQRLYKTHSFAASSVADTDSDSDSDREMPTVRRRRPLKSAVVRSPPMPIPARSAPRSSLDEQPCLTYEEPVSLETSYKDMAKDEVLYGNFGYLQSRRRPIRATQPRSTLVRRERVSNQESHLSASDVDVEDKEEDGEIFDMEL